MIKLTQVKIQESPELRGVNMAKGITSEDMSTHCVKYEDVVHAKVKSIMTDALAKIMDQSAAFAAANGADGDKVRRSLEENIARFRLDAGTGFTEVHKDYLLSFGTASGVQVEAIDFIAPKNRGGADKPAASANTITGVIEL